MKKILLFFNSTCNCLQKQRVLLQMLTILFFSFSGCSFFQESPDQKIQIVFPEWPAEYPALSCWLVEVTGESCSKTEKFFPPSDSEQLILELTVQKNHPVAVTAFPITFDSEGNEMSFFKCAGCVYPAEFEGKDSVQITWENGFSAYVFQSMYKAALVAGLTENTAADFMKCMNWKKFEEALCQQTENEMEKGICYNPWLCDLSDIFQRISCRNFRQTYLNMAQAFQIDCPYENVLSSYIPENKLAGIQGKLTVAGGKCNTFLVNNKYGLIVTGESEKNLSLKLVYLPIFSEEI